jgi:transposase InsO family protein
MNQRIDFINAWKSQNFTVSELCRRFDISRKTGYKWINRVLEEGRLGLQDRSRRSHHHPNKTPHTLVKALLQYKQQHPSFGPGKVVKRLRKLRPRQPWPAISTVGEIFKQHGLVKPRVKRKRVPPHTEPLRHATHRHSVWSADFKGDFALGNDVRCYPLTLFDNYSRFLIDCHGLYSTSLQPVKQRYEQAFRRYGLPHALRTDNGYPFASCGIGGLSSLSIWLLKLGVMPERIAPGHPEQNPRHERMHRTLKAAAINPAKANLSAQQRAFNRFRCEYNHERPHDALNDRCPGEVFHPPSKPYPERLPMVQYPENHTVRQVRTDGTIKWKGDLIYLASSLAKEPVGLRLIGNDRWQLYYAKLVLGVLDSRSQRIIRPS